MEEKESSAIAWLLEVSSVSSNKYMDIEAPQLGCKKIIGSNSPDFLEKIREDFPDIHKVAKRNFKNLAVSFSGGKDSLVVLDLAERVGIKKAVFSNTTIEFDQTVDYVEFLNDFYSLNIDIVTPPRNFFELVEDLGFPSRRFRWCCEVIKFGPLAKYARENNIDGFITGLRKEESTRRKGYQKIDYNPVVPVPQINPILDWSESDVWNYIKTYKLPYNPLYDYFDRIGCWCCPYRTKKEWEKMKAIIPDKIKKLEDRLQKYAEKLGIGDKEKFIYQYGWTAWTPPLKKITSGVFYSIKNSSSESIEIIFLGDSESQINKIKNLLWILTDDYEVIGEGYHKKIRINLDGHPRKKIKILIEKALNCIKCGACTALCERNALYLVDNGISVNRKLCTHCLKCLNTGSKSSIRGACIARNYLRSRNTLNQLIK